MKNEKNALLFGNNPDISMDERTRVTNEIEKIGNLTFAVNKDEEGWTAQCNEVKGIIASNTNPNPSNDEIESQIRDAIFSAFNVQLEKVSEIRKSPFVFQYSF
jgi:hypothetical protein